MTEATIKIFKWLGIFVCVIAAVAVIIDVSNSIVDKLQKLPNRHDKVQEKIIDKLAPPSSDELENYFPQMCIESMFTTAEKQGNELLGCYGLPDERGEISRWLVWLGLPDGNCTALMINNATLKMVEITCDFAWETYEILESMKAAGDTPKIYNYSD